MESEKVKELKDYIQRSADLGQYYMLAGGDITMMEVVDYINELEKKNAKLLDSIETVQNDRCVYKCELTKKHLKQFAERLKEKMGHYDNGWHIERNIDETLKEFTE